MKAFLNKENYKVIEPERKIPVLMKVDVLVCGGGTAGLAAAIAAAKGRTSVLLVERSNCMGGLATTGLVTCFAKPSVISGGRQIIKGIWEELVNRMVEKGGAIRPETLISQGCKGITPFDAVCFKLTADEMLEEWGVNILYHTVVTNVVMNKNVIEGVIIENKSGRQAILASVIVDATGDGDVAALAGADFETGRREDGLCQPLTTMFRVGGFSENEEDFCDIPKSPQNCNDPFHKFVEEPKLPQGYVNLFRSIRPGEYRAEMTRTLRVSGINGEALTRAEVECRKQIPRIMEYFRTEFPGAGSAYLIQTAGVVGVQDTRRIMGEYVLTEEDLLQCRTFEDTVAMGCYSIDIHNPTGKGCVLKKIPEGKAYGIPYRSLLPLHIENLLVAGRCISATFEAQTALRIMASCMATGEAAGTAAALCVRQGLSPRTLSIKALQDKLIAQGAYIGEDEPQV